MYTWIDEYCSKAGKEKSALMEEAFVSWRLHGSGELLASEREVFCNRLIDLDNRLAQLGRQIEQTQIDELARLFKERGGKMENIADIIPQFYTIEFKNLRIPVAKVAIFEQVLWLKKEQSEIQKRLATAPEDKNKKVE
jgi:hypothetical protein